MLLSLRQNRLESMLSYYSIHPMIWLIYIKQMVYYIRLIGILTLRPQSRILNQERLCYIACDIYMTMKKCNDIEGEKNGR